MSIVGLQNVLQILHSTKSLKSYTPVNPLIEALSSIRTSYFHPLACIIRDLASVATRDLRSFVIRFDFESYVRFEIRFVFMFRFEIFESSALSIVIRKQTIGGG